ncbi:hypothetical protein BBFGKLBO_00001 [Synechococcus sp. CBW1107]|nr:hypothetical protein BBFGKLBO_00001 [Synechococcus sp. CBW1107]
MQLQVELIAPDGQPGVQGLQPTQIVAQAAVPLGRRGVVVTPEIQLLQHFPGGPTAVIPHPRQPERLSDTRGRLPLQPVALHGQRVAIRSDRGTHQSQHLGAAAAAPAKQPVRERGGGVPGQLVGAEPAHPGGCGHRRQTCGEAEAVGKPGQMMLPLGEGAAAVGLALLELPQKRGRIDQHAVGFHPWAIDRLPAASPHRGADPPEQLGPVKLQPGVQRRCRMAEVELAVVPDQAEGRAEGALGGLPGVGHGPEPGQVEVSMAEQMEPAGFPRRGLPQLCELQPRERQQAIRVSGIQGFRLDPAEHQGAVVVERTAQLQFQKQRLPLPPALGQGPAAGAVEQVTAVDRAAVDPEFGGVGPPAQHQASQGRCPATPAGGTAQLQHQMPGLPTARPGHQTTGVPVGTMEAGPGVGQGVLPGPISATQPPGGEQVQSRT